MNVVNKDAAQGFISREKQFAIYHRNKLARSPVTEVFFNKIGNKWNELKNNSIANGNWMSDDDFTKFRGAVKEVYRDFYKLATEKGIGDTYTDASGNTQTDYTYVAGEFLEFALLAVHTYTGVFQQLKEAEAKGNKLANERAKSLAEDLYGISEGLTALPVIEQDPIAKMIFENPLHALDNAIKLGQKRELVDDPNRKPYHQVKAEAEHEARMKNDPAYRDNFIAETNARKQREYESVKTAVQHKVNQPEEGRKGDFVLYTDEFAKLMGLDEQFTHGTMLREVERIMADLEKDPSNLDAFEKGITPLYRQIRRETFEAYANKCFVEGRPIDFNYANEELDKLMGALVYAASPVDPRSAQLHPDALNRVHMMWKGLSAAEREVGQKDRELVLEHLADSYRNAENNNFVADGEARFQNFANQGKSTSGILRESRAALAAYQNYKKQLAENQEAVADQNEVGLNKEALDAAYALEKRIATRYASRAARFFRFISYRRQTNLLASMKKELGISSDARVADQIREMRIQNALKDASNPTQYDRNEKYKALTTEALENQIKAAFQEKKIDLIPIAKHNSSEKANEIPKEEVKVEEKAKAENQAKEEKAEDVNQKIAEEQMLKKQLEEKKATLTTQINSLNGNIEAQKKIIEDAAKENQKLQDDRQKKADSVKAEIESVKGELQELHNSQKDLQELLDQLYEAKQSVESNLQNIVADIMQTDEYKKASQYAQEHRDDPAANTRVSEQINQNVQYQALKATAEDFYSEIKGKEESVASNEAKEKELQGKLQTKQATLEESLRTSDAEKTNSEKIAAAQESLTSFEKEKDALSKELNEVNRESAKYEREPIIISELSEKAAISSSAKIEQQKSPQLGKTK